MLSQRKNKNHKALHHRKKKFLQICTCGADFLVNYGLHITICKSMIKYDMINKIVLGGATWNRLAFIYTCRFVRKSVRIAISIH